MSIKKSAPAAAGTTAGANTENFQFDFTAVGAGCQEFLLNVLPTGSENAIPAREIAAIIGAKPRQVTKQVEFLRHNGVPICGNQKGFYRPSDTLELREYLGRLHNRILSIVLTQVMLTAAADKADGQTTLEVF